MDSLTLHNENCEMEAAWLSGFAAFYLDSPCKQSREAKTLHYTDASKENVRYFLDQL